jgi:hypothetical protein
MTIIRIPRPKQSAMNPDRPVNTLLQAQIQHLQQAERRLPLKYRSEIYTHAIQTESEAAEYIREITEAIHRAHADAEAKRAKRKEGLRIVASASVPSRKRAAGVKGKRMAPKGSRRR